MAAGNTVSAERGDWSGGFLAEMTHFRVYKPMLGRIARQATCAAIWFAFALLAWRWYDSRFLLGLGPAVAGSETDLQAGLSEAMRYLLPGLLLLAGLWIGYRTVNVPRFADFLIAVEAEMNKVTWPSQGELTRSSVVVILLLASLTLVLFLFDVVWYEVFVMLGIR